MRRFIAGLLLGLMALPAWADCPPNSPPAWVNGSFVPNRCLSAQDLNNNNALIFNTITASGSGTVSSAASPRIAYYAATGSTVSGLAPGSSTQVLLGNSTWASVNLGTMVTGTLGAANGGTGFASYTAGDLLYASGATALRYSVKEEPRAGTFVTGPLCQLR